MPDAITPENAVEVARIAYANSLGWWEQRNAYAAANAQLRRRLDAAHALLREHGIEPEPEQFAQTPDNV